MWQGSSNMMFCPNCGTEISSMAPRCPACNWANPQNQQTPSQGLAGGRADFGHRLGGWLIDVAILAVVSAVLSAVLRGAGPFLALLAGFAYYTSLEGGATGQTVGKKVAQIRVVRRIDGRPLGFGLAAGRYFARIVSGLACFLGYLWMLWDPNRETWHDKMTGTIVVPVANIAVSPVGPAVSQPGWYTDPTRRFEQRYWDGGRWTEHVTKHGQPSTDPMV